MQNTDTARPLVVVGASAAGLAAVEAARESGYEGPIVLLNAEDRAPYKRTKISKTMIDSPTRDAFALHEPAWYEEQRVEFRPRSTVLAVHEAEQHISLDDGSALPYGALVLALGAEPVSPGVEGLEEARVYAPYTQAETERLTAFVTSRLQETGSASVALIGCGITSLEIADQLVKMGAEVTLFGRGQRLMRGALDETLQTRLRDKVQAAGVTLYENRIVRALRSEGEATTLIHTPPEVVDASLTGVLNAAQEAEPTARAGSGAELTVDAVVVACGLRPRSIPGVAATHAGIPVDRTLRVPGHGPVFACGDCARHPDGRITWLWRDAKRQGAVAGRNAAFELSGSSSFHEYSYVPFRLKASVFGDYYFSIVAAGFEFLEHDASPATLVHEDHDRYRALWERDGRVVRIVMANDKEHADLYMEAVVDGWSLERLAKTLVS
ncbi:MAG: NAD(P)/FAD-dependent oxidoreductase [Spirochaetota bacterium]